MNLRLQLPVATQMDRLKLHILASAGLPVDPTVALPMYADGPSSMGLAVWRLLLLRSRDLSAFSVAAVLRGRPASAASERRVFRHLRALCTDCLRAMQRGRSEEKRDRGRDRGQNGNALPAWDGVKDLEDDREADGHFLHEAKKVHHRQVQILHRCIQRYSRQPQG